MHAVSGERRRRRAPPWSCRCAGRCAAFANTTATSRLGRCSASCRAAFTRNLRAASLEALEDIGFAGLAVGGLAVGESEAERSRGARGTGAAHAGAQAPLPDGRRPAARTSSRRCGAESTCSIASCRRGTRATRICSRARACSIFVTRRIRRIPVRSRRGARATPAATTAAAYLRHLDKCGEILGSHLNTIHNLYFYQRLMAEIRSAIEAGRFADFAAEFYALMGRRPDGPAVQAEP